MNISGFTWPEEPLSLGHTVVPYDTNSRAAKVLTGQRDRPAGVTHKYNIHNEPAVVNRLIRMIEELIERDDEILSSDLMWYRNRLAEIKKELSDGVQPILAEEAGLGDRSDATVSSKEEAVSGNGGSLSGY